jgi:hypothetical protein
MTRMRGVWLAVLGLSCVIGLGAGCGKSKSKSESDPSDASLPSSSQGQSSRQSRSSSGSLPSAWKLPAGAPEWKPDENLLGELQDETTVGKYRIRVPKSFKGVALGAKTEKDVGMFAWYPPEAFDGKLEVMVSDVAAFGIFGEVGPRDSIDNSLKVRTGIEFDELTHETMESGKIDGLDFHRCRFKASEKTTKNRSYHGAYYVARDGNVQVSIQIQSADPDEKMLKLLESAAATIRKP